MDFDPGFLESMGVPFAAAPPQRPRLVIASQMSLKKDSFTHDGKQKVVHNIVKLSPFTLELQLDGSRYMNHRRIDFNTIIIDASLVFDDGLFEKDVPYVRHKPIEYHGRVSSVDADFMSLDIKIGVLTSHCENSLFRVKLRAVDANTGEHFPDLIALSEPIKVISKPDGLHRQKKTPVRRKGTKRSRTEANATGTDDKNTNTQENTAASLIVDDGTKQSLMGMLSRIVDEQQDHRKILNCLVMEARARAKNALLDGLYNSNNNNNNKMDVSVTSTHDGDTPDLDVAFRTFVDAYLKTDPDQRPLKIRKIVESNPVKTNEAFAEMIDRFLSEGVAHVHTNNNNNNNKSSSECSLSSSTADLAALLPLSIERRSRSDSVAVVDKKVMMSRSDSADLFAGCYDVSSNSPLGELASFFN